MAKQSVGLLSLTYKAKGAVTIHRAVGFDGAMVSAIGAPVLGISETAALANSYGSARALGTAVIELGAAVAPGTRLVSDAIGRAIPYDAARDVGPNVGIIGRSLEAGVTGEFVEALLGR